LRTGNRDEVSFGPKKRREEAPYLHLAETSHASYAVSYAVVKTGAVAGTDVAADVWEAGNGD